MFAFTGLADAANSLKKQFEQRFFRLCNLDRFVDKGKGLVALILILFWRTVGCVIDESPRHVSQKDDRMMDGPRRALAELNKSINKLPASAAPKKSPINLQVLGVFEKCYTFETLEKSLVDIWPERALITRSRIPGRRVRARAALFKKLQRQQLRRQQPIISRALARLATAWWRLQQPPAQQV